MTEYTGFISDIIRRSDKLFQRGHKEKLEVTALLMILSTGYLIPYERLRNV